MPLVLAGFLVIALIATIGLAAYTPGTSEPETDAATADTLELSHPISARVASAVLALAVAPVQDAELATSTTLAVAESSSDTSVADDPEDVSTVGSTTVETSSNTTEAEATATPETSADTTPPALQVQSPEDGATVTSPVVTFSGVAERGAEVFSGPYEAESDADGKWAVRLVLAPGENGALITARDAAGNETAEHIVVTYDPPDAATTTTKAPPATTTPSSETTTTKAPQSTTTTTKAPESTTTTTKAPSSGYSPQWPADSAGGRNVESWRSVVAKYWSADRVDCVLGIIKLESGGNPRASNGGRYLGLMQHSANGWASRAKGAGFVDGDGLVASPFNGEANIAAGAYLADRVGSNWRSQWTVWPRVSACGG